MSGNESENESGSEARGISRRGFIKGTAAVGLGTAATAAGLTPGGLPEAAAEPAAPTPPHGAQLRGMDLVVKSPTTEGRFGFMFKSQPQYQASDLLLDRLGATMEEQPVVGGAVTNNHNDATNENPNPKLTSGFTFVGQFVDHDITFDTTSPQRPGVRS